MKSTFFAVLIFFAAIAIHSSEGVATSAKDDGVANASQDTNIIPTRKYEFATDTNRIPILNYTYKGRTYAYFTTFSNLLKTPRWKVSDLNPPLSEPPLSVTSAVSVARKYAQGIFPEDTMLKLAKVEIKYVMDDIWFYDVQIKPFVPLGNFLHPVYTSTGDVAPIDIVVLMDGTVPDREERK